MSNVNVKTAEQIDLTISATPLAQADREILTGHPVDLPVQRLTNFNFSSV
jgi:hypothetical protein